MVSQRLILRLGVAAVILLSLVHFLLVPNLIRYYNEDCHISKTRYEAFKLLFQHIVTAYDTLNQTYWVDHGLLLGYHRSGDILPHDGDVDLTRIHNKGLEKRFDDKVMMSEHPGTSGNSIIGEMTYTGADGEEVYVTADLFRMEITQTEGKKWVSYFWNKGHREDKRYKYFDQHFEPKFNYEDIFPLQRRLFLGNNVTFPNNIPAVLSVRYGRLYRIPIPYKWRCYINTNSATVTGLLVLLVLLLTALNKRRKMTLSLPTESNT